MNKFKYIVLNNEKCVLFTTSGKYKKEVLVDSSTWDSYLNKYNWTVINRPNYPIIKTSINKLSVRIYRLIIEKEYSELDYWGKSIDHINNNSLDNRLRNLRIYTSKLNSTNVSSKNKKNDMHLIFAQYSKTKKRGIYINGYKVQTNIFDEVIYKHFGTIQEAKDFRDQFVIPYIEKKISDMEKKNRDIEFERGLRDKLQNGELGEVRHILEKYGDDFNVSFNNT